MVIRNALVMTTAVALALTACSQAPANPNQDWTTDGPTAVCTDGKGNRVDDDLCDNDKDRGGGGGFAFMYIGSGGYVPHYGRPVNGSRQAAKGANYSTSKSAIARGGFGSSARASASS